MKKLLSIIVLGLLLSGNTYAKKIIIECFGTYNDKTDFYGEKFKNNFIIDDKKKTWKMPTQIKPWQVFIINDKIVGRLDRFKKDSPLCMSNNRCGIGYHRLNRYTGEYISLFADIKKSELMKFHDDTGMFESDEKFFNRAGLLIFGQVASDPVAKESSILEESQCKAGEKKF